LLRNRSFLLAFLFLILFNTLILGYFHNRFWWPPDEGVYAHTAERMLNGEVLNKDVEEIHTGYIHFIDVAAFRAFGIKLVSLRYPLIVAAFIQSCVVFLIFAKRDVLTGLVAAVSATAFGTIQYLNPQPSWYCLLFVTLIALLLTYFPERKWTIIVAGFLVGLTFFFRQITGVFVAMGVVTYFIANGNEGGDGRDTWLARAVLGLMLVGTVLYVVSATNASGLLLIGIWPIFLLVPAIFVSRTKTNRVLEIAALLAVGFVAASLPILSYHVIHGSLGTFFDDTVFRALNIQRLAYLKWIAYVQQQAIAVANVVAFRSFHEVVNGIFWSLLYVTGLITGALTAKRYARHRSTVAVGALPVLAVFYGLVAIFQQIPIYFFYALPLIVAGLFWLSLQWRHRLRLGLAAVAILFSAIAIYYDAGQPLTRTLAGIIRGERVALVPATNLERVGLWVEPDSLKTYTEVVDLITANSQPTDTIFALPYNPEFYFLAGRKNPFRFWNTAVGIRPGKEQQHVFEVLNSTPPRIVVIAPRDRNNTPISQEIIAYVRNKYVLLKTVGPFEIYRLP
jgi:hypothetical protein